MDRNEKKYIEILSKEAEIPGKVKKQANQAYSIILSGLNEKTGAKELSNRKSYHKKRYILLAAAIILSFGTTVFAAARHWGLSDFFARYGNTLPQQAAPLIETVVQQNSNENTLINFKVREAVCDNQRIYVVLEAKPVHPDNYLLIAMDACYDDPAANMGIETKKGETLKDYARETGRQMLYVSPSLSNNGTYILSSADYTTEEDGTVVFILKGDNISATDNLTLTCNTTVNTIDMEGNYGEAVKASFDFQLTNKSSEKSECYQPMSTDTVEDTGVVVDKIEVSKTELGIYTELTYHAVSEGSVKDGLWFEYLDDNGKVWEHGLAGVGSVEEISDGIYVQKNDFTERELPEAITIRGFDCWEKTRFGSVTLNKE